MSASIIIMIIFMLANLYSNINVVRRNGDRVLYFLEKRRMYLVDYGVIEVPRRHVED